jgi:hypothetical protein
MLGHKVQVSSEISESSLEYLPSEHREHTALPLESLYVPGAHAEQLPPSGPVYPKLHTQSVILSEPVAEKVFGGHCVHVFSDVALCAPENLPRSHSVQFAEPFTAFQVPGKQAEHSVLGSMLV